jgi:hypothetical protein
MTGFMLPDQSNLLSGANGITAALQKRHWLLKYSGYKRVKQARGFVNSDYFPCFCRASVKHFRQSGS